MLQIIRDAREGLIAPRKESGFYNHAQEILSGLDQMRRAGTEYDDMPLGKYLCYWVHEKQNEKLDLSHEHREQKLSEFYRDIGVLDPGEIMIRQLANKRNDAATWLFPELIRSAIEIGLGDGPIYPNITAEVQRVSGERTAVMPQIRVNQNYPERLGEDQTMPEAIVTYGSRNVPIYPKGLAIKFTYDALAGMKVGLLQKFLQSQGSLMGLTLDADALNVLISGDQETGTMSAAVIGVDNKTTGLQYKDLVRVFTYAAGQMHTMDTIVVSFTDAIQLFDMDEFKTREQGTALITAKRNIPLPESISVFAKSNMPEGQIMVLDSKNALVEFDAEPLLIETSRLIFERIEGTATSMRVGFGNLHRTARVILDLDHEYADAGYAFSDYAWFTPLDNIPLTSV